MILQLHHNQEAVEMQNDNAALIEILGKTSEYGEFQDEYFREVVEKGVVYDDGRVIYTFKNGFVCTSYVKVDRRNKTKTQQ